MILLLDIGNTHVHVGLANRRRVLRQCAFDTSRLRKGGLGPALRRFVARQSIAACVIASVVPRATPAARRLVRRLFRIDCLELTAKTVRGVGIDYPRPKTIGADRLANAVAVKARFGAPAVVVDFGTAVTFDVVDGAGNYVGGIIAPGLALMTDYLHEKTALLPKIRVKDTRVIIGKNTAQAMLVGAVHGYRGLVRELILELKRSLGASELPVVATGGYARLMADRLPEISAVIPTLTLEGLRLVWELQG